MKNDNFAHPYNDYREPEWQHAHHHPYPDGVHYRHTGHPWNDTEPAANFEPWCPPHPIDDCVCVTEDDVNKWNAVTAISEIADLPWDDLRNLSGLDIATSANYWNSCYETVNTNSGYWALQTDVDNLSAQMSAGFDATTEMIYDLSGKAWNLNVDKKYDYPYVLYGSGKEDWPLRLSDHVVQLLYYVEHGTCVDNKWQIEHGGASVVPENDGPFLLKDTFFSYSGSVDDLNNKLLTLSAAEYALSETVESIIDLIGGGARPQPAGNWVNQEVSLEYSKQHGDNFYYWTSK